MRFIFFAIVFWPALPVFGVGMYCGVCALKSGKHVLRILSHSLNVFRIQNLWRWENVTPPNVNVSLDFHESEGQKQEIT